MKKTLFLLVTILFTSNLLFAQSENVGVNTTSPDNSAALHVTYITTPKGVLIPRMTTTLRGTIPTPANGLLIYNTDNKRFEVYDQAATTWRGLLTDANVNTSAWARTGNAGTTAGTDFLGTTDNIAFTIKTNNIERSRILANGNFGIGTNNPSSLFSVGTTSQFQVNGTGAINAATGITSSGNIIFSGLGANKFVKTSAGGQLSTFSFGRDLTVTGTDTALVVGLQGRNLSATAPTDGQVIKWNNALSQWEPGSLAGASGNTLNAAYNQGGAGAGREITANSGAVKLTGSNAADETLEITNTGNGGVAYLNNKGTGNTLLVESNGDTTLTVQTDGKVKIGKTGTGLVNIIRATINNDLPNIEGGKAASVFFSVADAEVGSTVMISPETSLTDDVVIGYARVSSAGNVEVRFVNVRLTDVDLPAMDFYITVIK
jgi:hypothetical protein